MLPKLNRPGRPLPWCVAQAASLSPTGKKRARWFRTKEQAAAWINDESRRLRNYSDKARNLSDEEKIEAAEAVPIARQHGFTLIEAVREKAERVMMQRASRSINDVVSELVAQLELEKKSASHLTAARYVGRKFSRAFDNALVCDLTTEELQSWFNECAKVNTPASVKNFRRYVAMFLRFAEGKRYLSQNPIAHLRLRLRDDAAISFLTPEQTRALLTAADERLRPYLALCAFAGLRPDEAKKLRWADVNETEIYIRKESTKVRQHRHVPILLNLAPWISAREGSSVFYDRAVFRAAVKAAGLLPWKQDQLRHGFGSFWLALHHDEARLAAIMGNSPEVIFSSYRVPVTKIAAAAYFQIIP